MLEHLTLKSSQRTFKIITFVILILKGNIMQKHKRFNWNKNDRRAKLKTFIEDGYSLQQIHDKVVNDEGLPSVGAIKRQALTLDYGCKKGIFYAEPQKRKRKKSATEKFKVIKGESRPTLAMSDELVQLTQTLKEVAHRLYILLEVQDV